MRQCFRVELVSFRWRHASRSRHSQYSRHSRHSIGFPTMRDLNLDPAPRCRPCQFRVCHQPTCCAGAWATTGTSRLRLFVLPRPDRHPRCSRFQRFQKKRRQPRTPASVHAGRHLAVRRRPWSRHARSPRRTTRRATSRRGAYRWRWRKYCRRRTRRRWERTSRWSLVSCHHPRCKARFAHSRGRRSPTTHRSCRPQGRRRTRVRTSGTGPVVRPPTKPALVCRAPEPLAAGELATNGDEE